MPFCNCDYCCFFESCDPDLEQREGSPLCAAYLPFPKNFTVDELHAYIDGLMYGATFYRNYLNKKELLND